RSDGADGPDDGAPGMSDLEVSGTSTETKPYDSKTVPDVEQPAARSPIVRKLATDHNIDLSLVSGSGGGGRVTRNDVEAYIKSRVVRSSPADEPSAPVPSAELATVGRLGVVLPDGNVKEIPRQRSRIAENMIHARQTAAHVWTSVEVDFERVAGVRAEFGTAFKAAEGFSLTYLPFIARAATDALAAYPAVNSLFDIEAGTHTFHRGVNLGIAVDLDQNGLLVANVIDADRLTVRTLARSIRRVAIGARGGTLSPDDLTGYTFTITNPGPYGSFMTAPIIPVSNAAILSTDTVAKKPVAVELPDGTDGIAIHHVGYLGLSWDHRVFDGATAVLFLRHIKESIESRDWGSQLEQPL
ncbi:MAG: 2-oxo acid dehydrogenase subunit E2, partial [Acidimicrobiales bacterium]